MGCGAVFDFDFDFFFGARFELFNRKVSFSMRETETVFDDFEEISSANGEILKC